VAEEASVSIALPVGDSPSPLPSVEGEADGRIRGWSKPSLELESHDRLQGSTTPRKKANRDERVIRWTPSKVQCLQRLVRGPGHTIDVDDAPPLFVEGRVGVGTATWGLATVVVGFGVAGLPPLVGPLE
jgi:hypothetical protein